jgi:hypothetical protein
MYSYMQARKFRPFLNQNNCHRLCTDNAKFAANVESRRAYRVSQNAIDK